jgi:transposase-like protein
VITIDRSGANIAAIKDYNEEHDAEVEIRQVKYLNNVVEQDHRAIKRQVRSDVGVQVLLVGCRVSSRAPDDFVQRSSSIR